MLPMEKLDIIWTLLRILLTLVTNLTLEQVCGCMEKNLLFCGVRQSVIMADFLMPETQQPILQYKSIKCHHTVYCETPLLRTPWNKDTSVLKLSQTMVYNINSPLKRGHPFNRAYICPNGVPNREISLYMKIVYMQYLTVLSLHTIVDYSLSQLYYITLFVL